jgi:N-acetylglucosamine-6-sulfatase
MGISRRRLLQGASAVTGAVAITAALGASGGRRRSWALGLRPTIVVIVADDMRYDFRSVVANLDSRWIDCVNATIETPLCGPARASLFRGMYSYRTGVTNNSNTYKMVDTDTIATRIRASGYRTVLTGKYLNGYPWTKGRSYVPPGWDVWNAAGSAAWKPGTQHTTDYVFGFAANQIRLSAAATPLFLYIAPQAPHLPANPPARYVNAAVTLPPIPPSFNEADVRDKPPPDNAATLLTATQIAQIDKDRLQIGRSLLGVNDGIASVLSALSDSGRLADSAIFFTSDNGYLLGEHRLLKKGKPYEEPSRIPMMVRWPGSGGRREPGVISSVDVSATVCALAGTTAPGVDGVDLSPLLSSGTSVRDAAYLEAAGTAWDGLRTGTYKYVEYARGARALYDLAADPFEMQNRASDPSYASIKATLAARLSNLRR